MKNAYVKYKGEKINLPITEEQYTKLKWMQRVIANREQQQRKLGAKYLQQRGFPLNHIPVREIQNVGVSLLNLQNDPRHETAYLKDLAKAMKNLEANYL